MKSFKKMTPKEKKAALVTATKELQEIGGFEPALKTNVAEDVMLEKLEEACALLSEDDELTDDTYAVLKELEFLPDEFMAAHEEAESDDEEEEAPAPKKGKPAPAPKKGKKVEEEEEEEDEEEDEDDEEEEEEAPAPKKGKKEAPAPAPKKGKKVVEEEEEEDDDEEEEDEKPAPKKGKKEAVPEKGMKKGKAAAPAKKAAEKAKGPGIIATIVELIENASKKKGISKDEILEELEKRFPEKEASSMKSTINVQVPNRITRERWEVGKTKDGGYFKK